jgi:hypothetical protein
MITKPLKPNPYVSTDYQPIELGGGLDFTRPKLLAEPGTMLDCLNFEVVDRGGYGRIAGLEPYDGSVFPYTPNGPLRLIRARGSSSIENDEFIGSLLVIEGTTNVFGRLIQATQTGLTPPFFYNIYYQLINENYEPTAVGQFVARNGAADDLEITLASGLPSNVAADTAVGIYNASLALLRADVTSLVNLPVGLHWFRDRLYAVSQDYLIYVGSAGGLSGEPLPGMYIGADDGFGNLATGRILSVTLSSGDWASQTANGWMQIEKLNDFDFPSGNEEDFAIYTDDTFTSTVAGIGGITMTEPLGGGTASSDLSAAIWQSRSDAQATAESADPGWSRIEMGWEVDYEEGYAESGELVKIEKGVTPNYTPSTATTTATTANLIVQAPTVTGEIAQVQGWKSTSDETVFAMTPAALASDDGIFLYGDLTTYGWGLNTGGAVKTNQPSGGTGSNPALPLTAFPPTGETLAFTIPSSYSTTIKGSNGYTYFLLNGFDGLATAVPENARITGITVSVKYGASVLFKGWPITDAQVFAGFTDIRLESHLMTYDEGSDTAVKLGSPKTNSLDYTFANFTESNDQTSGFERKARWTKTAESTLTYGGSTDLWGLSTLTRAATIDSGFTLGFRCTVDCGNANGGNSNDNILVYRPLIDLITVQITYVQDSVRYYFVDGSDVIQGDLVYYNTVSGTFQAGDASGTMQLVNVVKQAGTKYMIEDGMDIHTALPASTGNKVGVVAADMVYNGLPGLDALLDANSRYEFITANFYARDDLDGFYGVSGAGKAFSVNKYDSDADGIQDTEYMVKITTNSLDEAGDTPRHVAFHHYHLALGFSSGVVRLSVAGEPESFDGVFGAAEIGVGDKVTGLLSMKGMTLGVFCENSIWSIAGTDADNYATQVLAPYTGALEYSVVDMGIPMYCDSRGISTIEQSATYSNFQGQRLSSQVTPWILPRMIRYTDSESTTTSTGITCAIPVRAKNQYRVFFRDGKVLVCTINPEGPPSFTFSTYYVGMESATETNKYLVPLAWSSQVDQRGVERIHVSHYSPTSEISDTDALFVYELEQGWGFGSRFIPAYFTTNWYAKDPFTEKTIKNLRMDGLTYGYGDSVVTLAKEYSEVYNTATEPVSLPASPSATLSVDLKPATHMAHIGRTGRNFSIKIEEQDTEWAPSPPVVYQIMLTQYAPQGKTDS